VKRPLEIQWRNLKILAPVYTAKSSTDPLFYITARKWHFSINISLNMHATQLFVIKFLGVGWDWVHFVRRPLIGLLYQPRMIDEYEGFGGMRTGRGKRSTRRTPAPVPLCPPQIPHDLTWDRTRVAAVWRRRLTAWAMARHFSRNIYILDKDGDCVTDEAWVPLPAVYLCHLQVLSLTSSITVYVKAGLY
jgi:hypothetical protein